MSSSCSLISWCTPRNWFKKKILSTGLKPFGNAIITHTNTTGHHCYFVIFFLEWKVQAAKVKKKNKKKKIPPFNHSFPLSSSLFGVCAFVCACVCVCVFVCVCVCHIALRMRILPRFFFFFFFFFLCRS